MDVAGAFAGIYRLVVSHVPHGLILDEIGGEYFPPMLSGIEKGIQAADLGLNPSNDGNLVRVAGATYVGTIS